MACSLKDQRTNADLLEDEAWLLSEKLTLGGRVPQSRTPEPVLLQRIQLDPVEQRLGGVGWGTSGHSSRKQTEKVCCLQTSEIETNTECSEDFQLKLKVWPQICDTIKLKSLLGRNSKSLWHHHQSSYYTFVRIKSLFFPPTSRNFGWVWCRSSCCFSSNHGPTTSLSFSRGGGHQPAGRSGVTKPLVVFTGQQDSDLQSESCRGIAASVLITAAAQLEGKPSFNRPPWHSEAPGPHVRYHTFTRHEENTKKTQGKHSDMVNVSFHKQEEVKIRHKLEEIHRWI